MSTAFCMFRKKVSVIVKHIHKNVHLNINVYILSTITTKIVNIVSKLSIYVFIYSSCQVNMRL